MGLDDALEPPLPIDLYQLRCAVAALVEAVNHRGLLNAIGYRRADIAVGILARFSPQSAAIRRAVERLLSNAEDTTGSRTIDAIAELAALTHVDAAAAPALAAALLPRLPPPHQAQLFDGHPPTGDPDLQPETSPPMATTAHASTPQGASLR